MLANPSVDRIRAVLFFAVGVSPLFAGCDSTVVVDCATAQAGPDGLTDCNGIAVRHDPQTCGRADPPSDSAVCPGDAQCLEDADCGAGPHGHCRGFADPDTGNADCGCLYTCEADADCPDQMVCDCVEGLGRCVAATCTTSSDCGAGECVRYLEVDRTCTNQREPHAFACSSAADECVSAADCEDGYYCRGSATGFRCAPQPCNIGGRPFLVGGAERTADVVTSRAWPSALAPRADELAPEERARLVARWTRIGQLEHASIAAFARFALQLLQLGAPPSLLEDTARAMADETLHARLAFGLASAYAGAPVSPGPLCVSDALDDGALETIVSTLYREGCVGETFASVVAREEASVASDPVVKAVLTRIADDEQRHAELAWRALHWMMQAHGARVPVIPLGARPERSSLACGSRRRDSTEELSPLVPSLSSARRSTAALEREVEASRRGAPSPAAPAGSVPSASDEGPSRALEAHGVLSTSTVALLRRHVLRDVVEPLSRALIGNARRSTRSGSGPRSTSAVSSS